MAEQWVPKSKEELMSAVEREWAALMAVVEKLTPELMARPDAGGWSPKDNLAHLSEWMNALMGYHIDRLPAHVVMRLAPELTEDWNDFDKMNQVLFERHQAQPAQDVVDELKRMYEKLVQKLESMTFNELMQPRHAGDPEKRPLILWILGDTTEHFAEHRETIEKSLK